MKARQNLFAGAMSLATAVFLAQSSQAGEILRYDFETPEQISAIAADAGGGCVTTFTTNAHGGKQALFFQPPKSGGGGFGAGVKAPKDFTKGFASFWIYISPLDGSFGWCPSGSYKTPEGKNSGFGFSLSVNPGNSNKYRGGWGQPDLATKQIPHVGWTRCDVLLEPDHASAYIDGVEVKRVDGFHFTLSGIGFGSPWSMDSAVDDLVFNDDPAEFKPAGVSDIETAASADGKVHLAARQPLDLTLSLDRRAARAKEGVVTIEFLDRKEDCVLKQDFKIDWDVVKDGKTTVQVLAPASRHYWVTASYRDKDAPESEVRTLRQIDVQYYSDPKAPEFRSFIGIASPWAWLPADGKGLETPPTDWKDASKLAGFWTSEAKLKDVKAGWHRLPVDIPASWRDKRIVLTIAKISERNRGGAKAWVNGVFAGDVLDGSIDLTGKLKPGSKADIVVSCDAVAYSPCELAALRMLGKDAPIPWWSPAREIGIEGPVTLSCEPLCRIDRLAVVAHVATATLDLDFVVNGMRSGGEYSVSGAICEAGRALRNFSAKVGKDGRAKATIPWNGLKVWDIGKPNLYDLEARLALNGKTIDATKPGRIGFREMVFDGRIMKLNGNPISFESPMPTYAHGMFGLIKLFTSRGVNFIDTNHIGIQPDLIATCDEAGLGTDICVTPLTAVYSNLYRNKGLDILDDVSFWKAVERQMSEPTQAYGNQPSVLFYGRPGCGGLLEIAQNYNPVKMDGLWFKTGDSKPMLKAAVAAERKVQALLRNCEPKKPLIGQDSGSFNDVMGVDHYVGFMQIQEFIESDEYWLENGTKPYMIHEQAAPMAFHDWGTHARTGHGERPGYGAYLYVAEIAAVTKGDAAFHRQPVDIEDLTQMDLRFDRLNAKYPRERRTGEGPMSGPGGAYWSNPEASTFFRQVSYERAKEQYLNWRAEGIGMHLPWVSGKWDGAWAAISDAWQPVVGYIAGIPERRTDKAHILRPGETWTRQFLVMSNKRDETQVEVKWTATIGGAKYDSGSAKATVTPGGQTSIPIRVAMPEKNADAFGTLEVQLIEDGRTLCSDSKDFQVLANREAPALSKKIALIDPVGDSAKDLRRLGIAFQRLNFDADLSSYSVVVFGRRAFDYESKFLDRPPLDLSRLLAQGKRILVLEQGEEVLKNRFNFRTESVSPRLMFGRVAGHPVTAGLPDSVLNFWRGSATLTDGYEIARSQKSEMGVTYNGGVRNIVWHDGKEHPRPMKWGNSHNVATVVIEKPGRGNFRSLADCEFGLDYAALLEFEQGPGRMLFCQADVSGRTAVDPAADRLLLNMVSYLDSADAPAWKAGIAYLGGEKGAGLLETLQARFRKIADPKDAKPDEVLVLGDGLTAEQLASWKDVIGSFVAKGGTCFSFPRAKTEFNWLPFEISVKDAKVAATLIDKPDQPLLAGLSNSELYYQTWLDVVALDKLPKDSFKLDTGVIGKVRHGAGLYVFSQVWPDTLDVEKRFYLLDYQRRNYRLCQTLLNNLGCPMDAPQGLKPVEVLAAEPAQAPFDFLANATWSGFIAPASDTTLPAAADSRWRPVKVPGYVNDQQSEWNGGRSCVFWYRASFNLPDIPPVSAPAALAIGCIAGEDDVYVNGLKVGHTGRDTNVDTFDTVSREYKVPMNLLRKGANEVLVRVFSYTGKCGITGAPVKLAWAAPEPKLRDTDAQMLLATTPPCDFSGWWYKLEMDGLSASDEIPTGNDPRWMKGRSFLPGVTTEAENRTVWFRSSDNVKIKTVPDGAKPVLMIGTVDDEDTVFVNGVKVGHTGKDTNPKNYWEAQRAYPIPSGLLKPAGGNVIHLKTTNLPPGGGSVKGPMEIIWMDAAEASKLRLSISPYVFEVGRWDDPYWNGCCW